MQPYIYVFFLPPSILLEFLPKFLCPLLLYSSDQHIFVFPSWSSEKLRPKRTTAYRFCAFAVLGSLKETLNKWNIIHPFFQPLHYPHSASIHLSFLFDIAPFFPDVRKQRELLRSLAVMAGLHSMLLTFSIRGGRLDQGDRQRNRHRWRRRRLWAAPLGNGCTMWQMRVTHHKTLISGGCRSKFLFILAISSRTKNGDLCIILLLTLFARCVPQSHIKNAWHNWLLQKTHQRPHKNRNPFRLHEANVFWQKPTDDSPASDCNRNYACRGE